MNKYIMGEWVEQAKCKDADPDEFFPEKGGSGINTALRICKSCPVVEPCLDWAMRNERLGVWGGMSERQRYKLKKRAS